MIDLKQGDCLEIMPTIPDKSIDMILCDLPYGTTACKWDVIIPFEPLWKEYKRIIKDRGCIALFGSEIFSAEMIVSNKEMYKYSIIWKKNRVGLFAQAPYRVLNTHEDIIIFSKGFCAHNSKIRMNYYPQDLVEINKKCIDKKGSDELRKGRKPRGEYLQKNTNYPKSIFDFGSEFNTVHPTQKPVALLEYLIKTYTLENETILDNCMGSGSTGVACINTNRNFIGIEKEENYFNIAQKRIDEAIESKQGELFK